MYSFMVYRPKYFSFFILANLEIPNCFILQISNYKALQGAPLHCQFELYIS